MTDYVNAVRATAQESAVEILLDGKAAGKTHTASNQVVGGEMTVAIGGGVLNAGEHRLTVRKSGCGEPHVLAILSYSASDVTEQKGLMGLGIARQYFKVTEEPTKGEEMTGRQGSSREGRVPVLSGDVLNRGDLVEVELCVGAGTGLDYVLIEDFKPACLEPTEVESGWRWGELSAYRELRDDRVAFLVPWIPAGTYTLRYRVRVQTVGVFMAKPATVVLMYAAEYRANSAAIRLRVK